MPSWLPSIPYRAPDAKRGYWLPVTSTINWCEEDYYATIYSAELLNTITNLAFALLALRGLRSCLRNKHDRIFLITFAGYAAVGTGSFLFHSTLKYPMQLIDELSMIYTTCFSCYASFSYRRPPLYALCVALSLVSLAVFITAYYHYLQDPKFHQNAYALLTATVLLRSMYVMEMCLRPGRVRRQEIARERETLQPGPGDGEKAKDVSEAEQRRRNKRDLMILKTQWQMIAYGLTVFLGGFCVWRLDSLYCGTLRQWRREFGLPWGALLEFHGWWHIMTGIGAYFYITWGIWLRHCLNGKQDLYELQWPRLITSLPEVVLKSTNKTKDCKKRQ